MTKEKKILLDFAKWLFKMQNTNFNVKRNRIFTLGSLTLAILSINSGIMAIYISLEKTNTNSFSLFCFSIFLLLLSLGICFWQFKPEDFEEVTFFEKDRYEELKTEKEDSLLDGLIAAIEIAFSKNEKNFFPKKTKDDEKTKMDKITKSFIIALVLDFIAINLIVTIGILEYLNII